MEKIPPSARSRADRYLLEHGYAASRAQARAAIEAGNVRADGIVVGKPAQLLRKGAKIDFAPAHPYVSRGALKLGAALDGFQLLPTDCVCLDIGASTGGFTQVLLERGATRVCAVDVGHGQMDATLAADARVVLMEGVNARHLSRTHIPELVDSIVADVSFISLKLVLAAGLRLAKPDAWLVVLVKPQFEVGPENIGKDGVVRDAGMSERAVLAIAQWLGSQGLVVAGRLDSPITGGSGSREYLLGAHRA